ncbi:DUF2784 domain-containing protein [Nonomuraea sp. 3-1Str]|uniref:DUF2784 domain-containing protein n=1 Tax=Nonomuraea sp. 3-1Str TaxID=2929801 RepID=UPI00285DE67E|nr:DUF2784 domain-containing protein [Nonomuraea sp. 3-1Str]MDR8409516.1 DUF2784 domain-containing protein [Nonomuraea sp. 3-1Str]
MTYRLVADLAMVAHFTFLAYVVVGGFVAWRWRRTIWAHLAVVCWALLSVTAGVDCPLTVLEDWGRRGAGLPALPRSGFIDHYIEGVIYPEQYSGVVRLALAAVVTVSYAGYVLRRP